MKKDSDVSSNRTDIGPPGTGQVPDRTPLSSRIRSNFRVVDPILIVVPLLVFVSVFQLPLDVRRALSFTYQDPTLVTAFTSHYVHLTQTHLLSNVLWYLMVVAVVYLLALSNAERTRFYTALGGILLIFPVPVSYLNVAIPLSAIHIGFSSLNMALLGYALVEFSSYIEGYVTEHFGIENAPGFFFVATSFVAIQYASSTASFVLLGISLLLTAIYWIGFVSSLRFTVDDSRDILDRTGYAVLVALAGIVISLFLVIGFPQTPTTETGIFNVYAHFTGFSIGFITFYVWSLAIRNP